VNPMHDSEVFALLAMSSLHAGPPFPFLLLKWYLMAG